MIAARCRTALSVAVIGTALSGCPESGPVFSEGDADVVAAWSMLVPGESSSTQIHARVVLEDEGADCQALVPADGGDPVSTTPRTNPDPGRFPITVCEAAIDANVSYRVGDSDTTVAAVGTAPTEVHVYGDTGCKSDPNCGDSSVWPWPAIATAGAASPPDLILHMGDYNYRGTPGSVKIDGVKQSVYDAGDHNENDPKCALDTAYYSENAADSSERDAWGAWRLDFFDPAATLLPKAPWVFARGNHELCSRAGVGWFYLLDTGSDLAGSASGQRSCPDQNDQTRPEDTKLAQLLFGPPYVVGFDSLQIAVIDSANACDYHHPDLTTTKYVKQFGTLASDLGDAPAFFMTHRPLWAVKNGPAVINRTLQKALEEANGGALPDAVKLSLAGHMHLFESLTFTGSDRQPQVVIGNSGVELSSVITYGGAATASSSSSSTGCIQTLRVAGESACGGSAAVFGSLVLEQKGGSWSGQVIDSGGSVLADCPLTSAATCTFVTDPCACSGASGAPAGS